MPSQNISRGLRIRIELNAKSKSDGIGGDTESGRLGVDGKFGIKDGRRDVKKRGTRDKG